MELRKDSIPWLSEQLPFCMNPLSSYSKTRSIYLHRKKGKAVITLETLTNIFLNTDWQQCWWFLQKKKKFKTKMQSRKNGRNGIAVSRQKDHRLRHNQDQKCASGTLAFSYQDALCRWRLVLSWKIEIVWILPWRQVVVCIQINVTVFLTDMAYVCVRPC